MTDAEREAYDRVDARTPFDPACETQTGKPVINTTMREAPTIIRLRADLDHARDQLRRLQYRYNRCANWIRDHGGDPVTIGTVDIGERIPAAED